MSVQTYELADTIELLYTTFADYPLHEVVEGCPCCVGGADQRRIRTRPLRLLEPEDLQKYAFKALSTWGTIDDFRHFLPRLFELLSTRPLAFTDVEIIFGKLEYAEWRRWPKQEQVVIEHYFIALWTSILTSWEPTPYTYVDDYLCGIAQAIDSLESYLTLWSQSNTVSSRANLLAYVTQNWDNLLENSLENPFWGSRLQQMQEVVAWIVSPALQTDLTEQFEANIAAPQADILAQVIDALEQLAAIRSTAK